MDTKPDSLALSDSKRALLEQCRTYLMPGRVDAFLGLGIPLVLGRREGYRIWDIDGHELLDLHLNGGTFNLGHRNPEVLASLNQALTHLDIGNHHFPSPARAQLARALAENTPGDLHYSVFVPSGSEANDLAIRVARHATGRRKIVALEAAYHGRTGLSAAAGQDDNARYFGSAYPEEFIKVPFNDIGAMETALRHQDVAAVLMETIPATYGFPVPSDDYLPSVARLCRRYGALYVADEVQTGLGRTGHLWGIEAWGLEPDILVTGKGLSGGLYPIAAVVMTRAVGQWLSEQGWGYVSTFGGAEIGCLVGATVLDICRRPGSLANAQRIAAYLRAGLDDLRSRRRRLLEIRQKGLVMGLRIEGGSGAIDLSRALYRRGVWAMFSGFDLSVLQFKPGLLIDIAYCDQLLERLDQALKDIEA